MLALLIATLLLPPNVLAIEQIPARIWRGVKTYDMPTLQTIEPLPLRRVVGVRFGYRHRTIRHLKPNWYHGSIWERRRSGDREAFDHVQIMVSKADLPFFRALPAEPTSDRKLIVYGQVLQDSESNLIFLRLLGTKSKRDPRGNATISW